MHFPKILAPLVANGMPIGFLGAKMAQTFTYRHTEFGEAGNSRTAGDKKVRFFSLLAAACMGYSWAILRLLPPPLPNDLDCAESAVKP